MRQSGILAAAGLYALDHHVARLAEDHRRAKALAHTSVVDPARVHTNIVLLDLQPTRGLAKAFVAAAAAEGVLCTPVSAHQVRLVFHLDVTDNDLQHAIEVLAVLLDRPV